MTSTRLLLVLTAAACGGGTGGASDASADDRWFPDASAASECAADLAKRAPFVACELPAGVVPTTSLSEGSEPLFDPANLFVYELFIPQDQWQVLCENARDQAVAAREGGDVKRTFTPTWAQARLRVADEEVPTCVGVRLRGHYTLKHLFFQDSSDEDPEPEYQDCLDERFAFKPSFKVAIHTFTSGQRFHDQKHVSLGGREGGDSQMHDYLVSRLAENFDVPGPRVSHALVCVNGVYRGVFTVQEEVDDQAFLNYHFADAADGTHYKVPKWGPFTFYEGEDLNEYRGHYEPAAGTAEDDAGHEVPYNDETDLVRLLRFASFRDAERFAMEIDAVVAVDAWLKLIAIEATLPDVDGMFARLHNYTLYHHPTEGWWPVRYDWDQAFRDGQAAVPLASRDRLFDLVPDSSQSQPDTKPPNRCDGRPLLEDGPQLYSIADVRHPVLPARILYARAAQYLDRVEEFLTDVFVPGEVQAMIEERRQMLQAAYDGDPWMPVEDWASEVDDLASEDVPRIHADATAALQDARANPPGVAPSELRDQMIGWCGERSCWPYACP